MKKRITVITVCLTLLCSGMHAQNIDPTVEVRKDYEGRITEISKPAANLPVNDTLYRMNLDFSYSTVSGNYTDLYELTPLPFMDIDTRTKEKRPQFMGHAGLSFKTAPTVNLFYQPKLKTPGLDLVLFGMHDSYWADIDRTIADRMDNRAGLSIRKSWKKTELTFNAMYEGGYRIYYGNLDANPFYAQSKRGSRKFMSENLSSADNGALISIGVRSPYSTGNSFDYETRLTYRFTGINPSITQEAMLLPGDTQYSPVYENDIVLEGTLGPTFAKYHKIHFDYMLQSGIYGNGSLYGLATLTPKYRFEKNRWLFNLGVRLSVPFSNMYNGNEKIDGKRQFIFPEMNIAYQIIDKYLCTYAEVSGGDRLQSMSSVFRKHEWTVPEYMNPGLTTETVRAMLGFKGNVNEMFGYNIYEEFCIMHNSLHFTPDEYIPSLMRPAYQNFNRLTTGIELNANLFDFSAGLDLKYNYFFGEEPFMEFPFMLDAYVSYNWKDRIKARVDIGYRSTVPVAAPTALNPDRTSEIDGFMNLDILLSYVVNSNFDVYIRGGNILNSRQQYLYGYTLPRINFGIGLYVKF